jgi:hypothetical protein
VDSLSDEDRGCGNLVDAGNGLQQVVRPGVGPHRREQAAVDLGDLVLQRLDVGMDVPEHEQMPCAEIALQDSAEVLTPLLELAACQAEHVLDRLALDQGADHGPGRHAVGVADHAAELDAAVVQDLVQPVDLTGCSITVTTCSMRCTSIPATRRYKARNPPGFPSRCSCR